MPDNFYGGLDFGTSGASISIINLHKKLVYSNSVPYLHSFKNPNSWINSCEKLLDSLSKDEQAKAEKSALSTAKYLWNFLSGIAEKHNLPRQVAA